MTYHNIKNIITASWQHKRNTIGEIVQDSADIKQCIKNILTTAKGSMPFMPEFGTDIIQAVGEKSPDAADIAIAIVSKELPVQEPRIEVNAVSFEYDEYGKVIIKINYTEKATGINDYTEVYI